MAKDIKEKYFKLSREVDAEHKRKYPGEIEYPFTRKFVFHRGNWWGIFFYIYTSRDPWQYRLKNFLVPLFPSSLLYYFQPFYLGPMRDKNR